MTTMKDLNNRATSIGQRLVEEFINNLDIVGYRSFQKESIRLYDELIVLLNNNPDYQKWHSFLIEVNSNSSFNELDKTGEFSELVEKMKTIDAREDYFTADVMPLIGGIDAIIAERDQIKSVLNDGLEMIISMRRDTIKLVM